MTLSGGNVKERSCPAAVFASAWHILHFSSALVFHIEIKMGEEEQVED